MNLIQIIYLFFCTFPGPSMGTFTGTRKELEMDETFYGRTLNWILGKDVLQKESCFALNFGCKRELPFPQFPMTVDTNLALNLPKVTWYVDPKTEYPGAIAGPPPGLHQSKCFLVFIGGKYLHQLGEVMEKVKAVGVAVRN